MYARRVKKGSALCCDEKKEEDGRAREIERGVARRDI